MIKWIVMPEAPNDDGTPTGKSFLVMHKYDGVDEVGDELWSPCVPPVSHGPLPNPGASELAEYLNRDAKAKLDNLVRALETDS